MASKRKSTVPCMIPSKSKHVREEIILGSLPELLPTIPEDSILSISGEEVGHFSHSSSKSECGKEIQKGGTYSCPTCHFESRDLNYFLDHMHNCHLDFRAQPTFYCLNCGVSVVRFEALALHNANTHPGIMEGLITASLTVNKRDGVTTVEQSLFTDGGDEYKDSGISLSKTPIAKLMKAKGEHKRIVVSHTVEVRKKDTGKDADPSMMTNVPELQNGAHSAPAMPRTTVTHVITTTVSNQNFHQHTPSLYTSPSSSDSNKDLPKVMIPLSSIPTYDAAMDTSSFLKTSFGKFPYPTKAELCYLTVVSEFPEEQIKLWFTAQRLKQGISWSPEEIEDARRKMFNTVFQGGAPQKQPATQRQINHIVTHHTVAGHAGLKGPNYQMPKLPFGSLKRPGGVIAAQPNMSTNPNVTRVSYSTPVIPPKFPSVVKNTQVLTKSTQPTVEPDKSNGLGQEAAGGGGCVSSTSSSRSSSSSSSCSSGSSSSSSIISSSNGGEALARRPASNSSSTNSANNMAACSANISNNSEHCLADINSKANVKGNSLPTGAEGSNGIKSKVIMDNTSKSNATCNSHNSANALQPPNAAANDDASRGSHNHKTNNISVSSDSVPNANHTSKSPNQSTSAIVIAQSSISSSLLDQGKCNQDFPMKSMSILQQLIKDEDHLLADQSCPEMKVDPIKINLRRPKMSEAEPEPKFDSEPRQPLAEMAEMSAPQPSFSAPWGTKTPQQLHVLRQVFSNTRWPSSQQYEDLSVQTGLPKSEVVRWFSDSRYSHKNGQLRWLGTYQLPPADLDDGRNQDAKSMKDPAADRKKFLEQEINRHLEGEARLKSGQRLLWQESYSPLLGLVGSGESREPGRASESGHQGALQDPWAERADNHQQPVANQALIDQQPDASQARDRLRMELLEV